MQWNVSFPGCQNPDTQQNLFSGRPAVLCLGYSIKHNDFSSIVEGVWRFVEYPLQCLANRTKSTQNWIPKMG
jgi:hypothetical protein